MKAKVCHFYGWRDKDIEEMPFKLFLKYHSSIAIIEAQKSLNDIEVGLYPNLKAEGQKKAWKKYADIIKYGIEKDKGKQKSLKEIAIGLSRKMF